MAHRAHSVAPAAMAAVAVTMALTLLRGMAVKAVEAVKAVKVPTVVVAPAAPVRVSSRAALLRPMCCGPVRRPPLQRLGLAASSAAQRHAPQAANRDRLFRPLIRALHRTLIATVSQISSTIVRPSRARRRMAGVPCGRWSRCRRAPASVSAHRSAAARCRLFALPRLAAGADPRLLDRQRSFTRNPGADRSVHWAGHVYLTSWLYRV